MASQPESIKRLVFWIIAFLPLILLVEGGSWIVLKNSVPSRIRNRIGCGSIEFHLAQRKRVPNVHPKFIHKPATHVRYQVGKTTSLYMFDADLGWDYPPGIVYRDIDNIIYSHGPDGERKTCTAFPTTAIATYGDSFTYGTDVGDEQTWQTYLAKRLYANVLNYGVAGFGTDQACLKYRMQDHVSTNIVMLGIWPENINRVINRYRPFLHYDERLGLTKPLFVKAGGGFKLLPNPLHDVTEVDRIRDPAFLQELAEVDYWFQLDKSLPSISFPYCLSLMKWRNTVMKQCLLAMRKLLPSIPASYPCNPFDEEAPFAVMCHAVDLFVDTARSRGATPIVLIMAHRDQVRELMDFRLSRAARLVTYLRERGYPFIDLLQEIADMQPTEEQLDQWFIGHTSSEGNKIVADIIGRHLEKDYAHLIGTGTSRQVLNQRLEILAHDQRR